MIVCERVSFGYGAEPLVRDLDLTIERGQFIGVVGPNGSGKSTLVRLLLGLVQPARGRVLLDGKPLAGYRPRELARRVGAVLQDEALDFPFTALEVVLMGRLARLGPFGFERAEDVAAAERAMADTGVSALADRPLSALSGGERKRVLLARALAQEPELLILDEPAAALDLGHQRDLFRQLAARHARGVTVIAVAHDLGLAAAFCERVLLLAAGAAPVDGPVREVLTPARVRAAFGIDVGSGEAGDLPYLVPRWR